jgi:predicted amidohydrolase YtcJ
VRRDLVGGLPDQKLTRFEALRGFTVDAAYAAFDESQLGRIAPGGLADFLLLDRDIMDPYTCPDDDILDARAEQVYLGGERVL